MIKAKPATIQKIPGIFLAIILSVLFLLVPHTAKAKCGNCGCIARYHSKTQTDIANEHTRTKKYFGTAQDLPTDEDDILQRTGTGRLGEHQNFLTFDMFRDYVMPAMMMMTEQFTVLMAWQEMAVGTLFDAKTQLQTQTLLQKKQADAQKGYHPSTGMCVFGTNIRSLAAAEQNINAAKSVMSRYSQNRQLGNINVNAATGGTVDRTGRLDRFASTHCDEYDNNRTGIEGSGLSLLCGDTVEDSQLNNDIDFMRIVYSPRTLETDFTNGADDDREIDIMAMADNLYSHDIFRRIDESILDLENNPENADDYLDVRAVVAKRSVAEHSFHSLTAMKTQGSGESTDLTVPYLTALMVQLGMPEEEVSVVLGERPSYLAQMEILAKRLYQNPHFYTDLYDKPVNVRRKRVAMQAINLMLDRDMYESKIRSEMLLSVLLEMNIITAEKDLEGDG